MVCVILWEGRISVTLKIENWKQPEPESRNTLLLLLGAVGRPRKSVERNWDYYPLDLLVCGLPRGQGGQFEPLWGGSGAH